MIRTVSLAVFLLAGCGDSLPGPDASVPSDASPGLVSLRYLTGPDGFAGGHLVFFQNANGSPVNITTTRDDGTANAFMADGGFVTLVASTNGSTQLWTWMGVRGGDQLVLDRAQTFIPQEITFDVLVPPDPGASSYQLQTRCGPTTITGAQTAPVSVTLFCDPGPLDLLVLTRAGGSIYHSIYQSQVTLRPQSFLVFDPPYLQPRSSTVTTIKLPASISSVSVAHGTADTRDLFYQQVLFMTPTGGAFSATFGIPQTTKVGTLIDLNEPLGSLVTRHIADWTSVDEHHFIDYSTLAPPELTARPTFDISSRTMSWAEAAGPPPDAVIAGISYGGSLVEPRQWTLIARRAAEPSIQFPVLSRPELMPAADDSVFPFALTTMSAVGGYDRIRPDVLGRIPGNTWPMTGESGRAVYQDLN